MSTHPQPSNRKRIHRTTLTTHDQYEINQILEINELQPTYPVYDLQIRGHTSLIVGDTPDTPSHELQFLDLRFSPLAVRDLGVELLRASHIIIPASGITFLETVVNALYTDDRELENPLNNSKLATNKPITYPG